MMTAEEYIAERVAQGHALGDVRRQLVPYTTLPSPGPTIAMQSHSRTSRETGSSLVPGARYLH